MLLGLDDGDLSRAADQLLLAEEDVQVDLFGLLARDDVHGDLAVVDFIVLVRIFEADFIVLDCFADEESLLLRIFRPHIVLQLTAIVVNDDSDW